MNTRILPRTISLLLALLLVWQTLPLSSLAAELPEEEPIPDAGQGQEISEAQEAASQDTEEQSAPEVPGEPPSEDEAPAEEPASEQAQEALSPSAEPDAEAEPDSAVPAAEEAVPAVEEQPVTEEEAFSEEELLTENQALSEEDTAPQEDVLSEEEQQALERTQALDEELGLLLAAPQRTLAGSYESELSKFPASYQTALKALHSKHPKWVFVAVNTGLDWNKVIAAETGTASTMEYNEGPNGIASHLLLNNRDGFYSASAYSGTNHYKDVDGRFVSASRAAVAYYMDPRNFLNQQYIFQFEAQTFNNNLTKAGVTGVLRTGRNDKYGMANRTTYVTTGGSTAHLSDLSSNFGSTYPEIIYNLGVLTKVSPYFVASKIVQETSADTTKSVISGTYSGYTGYYNFFNIGAYVHDGRSAVENGMRKAKSEGWANPILALEGGVRFLADKYIYQGQDTIYYMRFNVSPNHKYDLYTHQYMSATAAAAGEGRNTCAGYEKAGTLDSAFVFYIPVYRNMPDKTSVVSLTPATTGKTTAQEILYSAPSATGTKLVTVPKGSAVTVVGGSVTSSEVYLNRLYYPYWYQVKVTVSGKSYTGYIHEQSVSVNQVYHLKTGSTKSIASVTRVTGGYSGPIYYETSDPTVATVSATTGLIRAVGRGTCTVYAISGGGSFDAIGVKVSSSGTASGDKEGTGPSIGTATETSPAALDGIAVLKAVAATDSGVRLTWYPVENAAGYRVYRRLSGGRWVHIGNTASTDYTDFGVQSGTEYTYTVRAMVDGALKGYDHAGLTVYYLSTPFLYGASVTDYGIQVEWSGVDGADGYRVYRKTEGSGYKTIAVISSGKTTSWLDTAGLASGNEYTYTVRAIRGSAISSYNRYGVSAFLLTDLFTPPVLVAAGNGEKGVSVKWKAVSGAEAYKVYRKSGSSRWAQLGTVTGTSFVDTSALSGTTYTYTVRAVRNGKLSGYDKAGVSVYHLSSPTLLSAQSNGSGMVVRWKAVAGAKGYQVYRQKANGKWKLLGQVGAVTSYTDTLSLASGKQYTYTVRAVHDTVRSGYHPAGVTGTASMGFGTPVLKKIANGKGGVVLTWLPVTDATGYRVYRKTAGSRWAQLGTSSTTAFLDKSAVSGTQYVYTVRAYRGSKLSGYDRAGLKVLHLSIPSLHSASPGSGGITLKWGSVPGATGYWVYRRVSGGAWTLIQKVNTTSCTDNDGLRKGTAYTYTVRAVSGSTLSYYVSKGISATAAANSKEVLVNYVTTGTLNYRTGAGTSAPLAGTLSSGTVIQVVDGDAVDVSGTPWFRCKLNGSYYYISSRYLNKA